MVSFCQSGLGSVGWSRVAVDAEKSLLKRDFDDRRAAQSSRLADAGRRCEALVRVGALTLLVIGGPVEARNILVPSGGASAAANAAASMATSVQQAQAITQQSINSLMGATAAIRAMQQAQNAAHNLVLSAPSAVPNGLVSGGLQVAPGVGTNPLLWQNANLPTQSNSNGWALVTVKQTAQKAILTWSNFNIGKTTQLYFDQSAGTALDRSNTWVVLNRILDPSGVPSQILGSIKAEGSVYVLNPKS